MSKQANFFSIGVFVIAAFVLAVGTFVFFGSVSLYRNTATIVSTFRGSTNGLRQGAKVKAYGVEVGQVKRIMLHRIERTDEVVIPVLMEIDLDNVSDLLGFDSVSEFSESECLAALERDAHATLQLDSYVTGLLYVEIVFGQSDEGFILVSDRFSEYRAMPSLPTDLEIFFQSLQMIARNLGETDFVGLIEETKSAVADVRSELAAIDLASVGVQVDGLLTDTRMLVNNPGIKSVIRDLAKVLEGLNEITSTVAFHADGTFEQLDQTLNQLESAAREAKAWMNPSNALYQEAVDALDQVGDAARSMRILVQYLERNPNAIITGKPVESTNP